MAFKGSLREASLADVCQLLALGQKTGCLSITDRSRFGQIYFDRGRITYSRIVNRRDRLGDLLVREGVLTQEQLSQVLELQSKDHDQRLGDLLIEQQFITRDDLKKFVRMQIEEAIYHLFTWSRGSFFFEADERPDADILVLINPDSLLLEAARRVDEWSVIEKKIPSLDLVFEVERSRVMESYGELTPEQQRIVALLDGSHSVQEIADETGMSEFDIGKALYGFIQAGFAHPVGKRDEDGRRGTDTEINERRNLGIAFYRTAMFEDARREFERVLELDPGDAQARFHVALVTIREGRHRDGLRQLKRLLEDNGPTFGAFVNMAYTLRELGRAQDAVVVLDEAEHIRLGTAEVALRKGVLLLEIGDVQQAAETLAEYRLRLDVRDKPSEMYYYHAALAAALLKKLGEADALVQEGLKMHPLAPSLLLLAGAIAERRNDYLLAESYFRKVIEEHPTMVQAHKNLGDVAYRRGSHDEALDHYMRAVQLDPQVGDDTFAKIGNILYKKRNREEAVRNWERALELNPANQVVRNNLEIVLNA